MDKLIDIAEQCYGMNSHEFKTISKHISALEYNKKKQLISNEHNLSDEELLAIIMLEGFASNLIQTAAFNSEERNCFTELIIIVLDSALRKIPPTSHTTLYRQESFLLKAPSIGEEFTIDGYWTTSKDDFDNTKNIKWIITPLPHKDTKAHNIYEVYNHGATANSIGEFQVEFERGAKFKVNKIIKCTNFTEVHVSEIK